MGNALGIGACRKRDGWRICLKELDRNIGAKAGRLCNRSWGFVLGLRQNYIVKTLKRNGKFGFTLSGKSDSLEV